MRYCAATVKISFLIYNFHFLLDNKGSFLYNNLCCEQQAQLAQLVEQRTENPCVSGSIPELGIEKKIRYYGILAQLVEHLTFNQVVRGSNPRTLIVEQAILLVLFVILTYILITPMLCKRFSTDIICEKV